MTIIFYFLLGIFFLFLLSLFYNFQLKQKEKIVGAPFNMLDSNKQHIDEIRERMIEWTAEQIKQFKNETIYIFAGEFNYEFYDQLLTDELENLLKANNVNIIAIGGPFISSPDQGENKIIEWARNKKIELYIRDDNKRTIGHGIVSKNSDKLCILEDPHDEFSERSAYAIHNSKLLCGMLRKKVNSLLTKSIQVDPESDNLDNLIADRTKSREEIEKQSHPIELDNRLPDQSYLTTNENPIKERNRLKWLAQVL